MIFIVNDTHIGWHFLVMEGVGKLNKYREFCMRKTIKKSELSRLIGEAVIRELLMEDRESKNRKRARKLAADRGADPAKLENALRHDVPNVRLNDYAFIYGATRMCLDGELADADSVNRLNTLLRFISAKGNPDNLDLNLGGLSLKDLYARYEPSMKTDLEALRNEMGNQRFEGNGNYDIRRIDTFEDAKPYKAYTCSASPWCITYREDMWEEYTMNGENAVYFALRNGFKDVPEKTGENTPLDDYGLSMLCVQVNLNGSLAYCTPRWNHENGGSDHVMDERMLSKVIGGNFYSLFPPYTKEELMAKGVVPFKDKVADVMERLRNGAEPRDCFDWVGRCEDGFYSVCLNNKWSFINSRMELIGNGNLWFDEVDYFHDGLAAVKQNNKGWSFINERGELIGNGNAWFDRVSDFINGFARVTLNGKGESFINKRGELIGNGNRWFDGVTYFSEGFAVVKVNGKLFKIDTEGRIMSNESIHHDMVKMITGKVIHKLRGR